MQLEDPPYYDMVNGLAAARKNAEEWLQIPELEEDERAEVNAILAEGGSVLLDRFCKKLDFGTGGMRALMGTGSNRINRRTIASATQGLAQYLKKTFEGRLIQVAIAYDSRRNSAEFAHVAAQTLSAYDIEAHLFPALRPTPLLSFAVRRLRCQAGIVITASHNPKEYNGYKVYWEDGAQLLPPHDQRVVEEVNAIVPAQRVGPANEAKITLIGPEVEENYFEQVHSLIGDKGVIERQRDISIVYSSLHGAGGAMVPRCIERIGFVNCATVETQAQPDGAFPTVAHPNPEEPEAMRMALALGEKRGAEIVMATDPDADRVGIGIRDDEDKLRLLNGNQMLSLLVWFIAQQRVSKGGYVVKSIVTTDLVEDIATRQGAACYSTLTGFKYIAQLIDRIDGGHGLLAAGEESYGFLLGNFVRDKDAVSACAFFAYMAATARDRGERLYDWLLQIYLDYGLYVDELFSLTREGAQGELEIRKKMEAFRAAPPSAIAGEKVVRIVDFQTREDRRLEAGTTNTTATGLPHSNVLQFYTAGGSKISIRPSGTEPKMKLYVSVKAPLSARQDYAAAVVTLKEKAGQIKNALIGEP